MTRSVHTPPLLLLSLAQKKRRAREKRKEGLSASLSRSLDLGVAALPSGGEERSSEPPPLPPLFCAPPCAARSSRRRCNSAPASPERRTRDLSFSLLALYIHAPPLLTHLTIPLALGLYLWRKLDRPMCVCVRMCVCVFLERYCVALVVFGESFSRATMVDFAGGRSCSTRKTPSVSV